MYMRVKRRAGLCSLISHPAVDRGDCLMSPSVSDAEPPQHTVVLWMSLVLRSLSCVQAAQDGARGRFRVGERVARKENGGAVGTTIQKSRSC